MTARNLLAASDPLNHSGKSRSNEVLQVACSQYLLSLLQVPTCSRRLATDEEMCSTSLSDDFCASERAGQHALNGQQIL